VAGNGGSFVTDFDIKSFQNPAPQYCVNPMTHRWPKGYRKEFMKALKDYGFGGVVTNVEHSNGFTANPDNLEDFKKIVSELEENDLKFWIYDENGYPSGYAGGKTLVGHPELEAKGFYMRRRVAYESRHTVLHIDEESDKIIWAAKYPLDTSVMHDSFIIVDKMEPLPFTDELVECELGEREALFVFIAKPAYEGSHCTHNVCSYSRYINVMNPAAVRRFIDLCFEPIVKAVPDAYVKATAVFTDEPSLQVSYGRSYEMWPYALAPWVDGLFEEFEAEYGFSIMPYLPYLFETISPAVYPIRVKFYNLVGKIIARAYSRQLSEWCEVHGGKFSGHYLSEENMVSHVKDYGSYLEVVKAASYPGIDVLACYPEIYCYNTAKYAQMAVRKKGTNGMMVEICPFLDVPTFEKDPIENMTGIMGLLYLSSVRITNSYFAADYSGYAPEKFGDLKGYMNQAEANTFNEYVGRMGYMLDNIQNDCNTFVYYGVEDVQAKIQPSHSTFSGPETEADHSTMAITKTIYEAGYDFYYADRDDIVDAAKSLKGGTPIISGCEVKSIIIPALDIMYDEALSGLVELQNAGVTVMFLDKLPQYGTELDYRTAEYIPNFKPYTTDDIMEHLAYRGDPFTAESEGVMLIKGKFNKDGKELYFVDNNTRKAADVLLNHKEKCCATLYNPVNGEITPFKMGEKVCIPSFRGVFVLFD
jgi:hypothetical protein